MLCDNELRKPNLRFKKLQENKPIIDILNAKSVTLNAFHLMAEYAGNARLCTL